MEDWVLLCLEAAACDPGAPRWMAWTSFVIAAVSSACAENPFDFFSRQAILALMLRASLIFSIHVHEYSHVLAAVLLWIFSTPSKSPASSASFSSIWVARNVLDNALCNVPPFVWLKAIIPYTGWPQQAAAPHVRLEIFPNGLQRPTQAPFPSDAHKSAIEYAGLLGSLIFAITISYIDEPEHQEHFLYQGNFFACKLAAWLVVAGASATDLLGIHVPSASALGNYTLFHCGNFGMLVVSACNKLVDVPGTLRRMAGTTAARGGQAGGLVTVLRDGSTIRSRYVPTKRADVAAGLLFRFRLVLWMSQVWVWIKRTLCCFVASSSKITSHGPAFFLGHTRFATSSGPSVRDTHPHRFSNASQVNIWRCATSGWYKCSESFELYVTHNGDLDYMEELDSKVLRTHHEIGIWLQLVLRVKRIPGCDSVKVAGMLELLRTQGVWMHALRLGSLLSTARASFSAHILETKMLKAAAAVADEVFESFVRERGARTIKDDPSAIETLSTWLAADLYAKVPNLSNQYGTCEKLARLSTIYFLENDLFTSLNKFLAKAHGSFGISACCSLDRDLVVIASRGQAMSLAFNEMHGVVLWGSEATAQSVPFLKMCTQPATTDTPTDVEMNRISLSTRGDVLGATCTHRYDLDEDGGEIFEVRVVPDYETFSIEMAQWTASSNVQDVFRCQVDDMGGYFAPFSMQSSLHVRIYQQRTGKFLNKSDFQRPEACILIASAPSKLSAVQDVVAGDIQDIPRILATIRKEWSDVKSSNILTSQALYRMLHKLIIERNSVSRTTGVHERLEIDVLILGCEASLWIGEQFAGDLQNLFPALRVVAISANKVLGVLSNSRGHSPMSGFAFSSRTMSLKKTIIISLSHSGQTFPTLHATHTLHKLCGDRVFVMTGSVDSKMAAAVGQLSFAAAPWIARTWTTFAGWRPAEALTVSTVAFHQTMTELLLYLAHCAVSEKDKNYVEASGFKMDETDLEDMRRLNSVSALKGIPEIVGYTVDGTAQPSAVNDDLKKQGRKWALHVLEGPYAWCLSAAYICLTVIWGHPVFFSVAQLIDQAIQARDKEIQEAGPSHEVKYVMLALDSVLYSFLPLFWCMVLRIVQRRELLARLGKRTLVIGDVPYVHQLLEAYVSKLFSLSYSIASLDVHGANAIDHLVHRFTHRVYRGTLVAVGRTDGRLFSQSKGESWILMAMQQCKAIMHLGAGPEIISVGHNPYLPAKVLTHHTALSTTRPRFLCETLLQLKDVKTTEPMKLSANIKEIDRTTNSVDLVRKTFGIEGRDCVGQHHLERMLPSQLKRVASTVHQMLDRASAVMSYAEASRHGDLSSHELSSHSLASLADRSRRGVSRGAGRSTDVSRHNVRTSDISNNLESEGSIAETGGPAALDAAIDHVSDGYLLQLFSKTATLELWHENRHASFERYIAFLVLFHQMAARVASFAPLSFQVWRSQSQLRVATTAAPISAAEIQKKWDADFDVSDAPTLPASDSEFILEVEGETAFERGTWFKNQSPVSKSEHDSHL